MFYRQFISLKNLDLKTEENIDYKFVVLNLALKEYDELIKQYTEDYERKPKNDKSYDWKQEYDPKNLKVLDYQPVELETKSFSYEDRSDIKQSTQLEQLKLNEISKPLWMNLPRNDYNSLIKDIVDNLDNEDCKTIVNGYRYDLKNAENFLLEIITKKISENEARKLLL